MTGRSVRPAPRGAFARRFRAAGAAPGAPRACLIAAATAGLAALAGAAGPSNAMPEAAAMAGTEDYCTGFERTFHGAWVGGDGGEVGGGPVLFRIGFNEKGKGCYAQLNVMRPPGVAPYELSRFRVGAEADGTWTLRYRDIVLEIDPAGGTAARQAGAAPAQPGTLLARPPQVGDPPSLPSAGQRERWYGRWRGRLSGLPFRVTIRLSDAGQGRVHGRISSLLMNQSFPGHFHGEMLVFRWRNRHVGLVMEPGGDVLTYHDHKGRTFHFRRR